MAALALVSDYLADARVLLQDLIPPYRYPDADLVAALNRCVLEARRIRPDLFLARFSALPSYSTGNTAAPVVIDDQYRAAFLYYIVGMAQLRDDESTTDARAAGFLSMFTNQLTG
jgi:hypothetical protein